MTLFIKKYIGAEFELALAAIGIYTSYLYFGVLQEHIYKSPNREPFKFPEFVVFSQMVIGYILSHLMLFVFPAAKEKVPYFNIKVLYGAAFAYSMFFTNFSLTLISYPTQALAKSCKILPVMLGSLFVKDVKYHPLQYFSVVMITLGVVIFNYKGKAIGNDSTLGLIALFGSLFLDSFTSYYSELVRRTYCSNGLKTMTECTGFGALLFLPVVIVMNVIYSDTSVFDYIAKYPDILLDIFLFGTVSAIGNMFIFWMLSMNGSVTLTIITTTRKFMTVIVSILWFNHSLSMIQGICMILVFSGTILDLVISHKEKKHKVKE